MSFWQLTKREAAKNNATIVLVFMLVLHFYKGLNGLEGCSYHPHVI